MTSEKIRTIKANAKKNQSENKNIWRITGLLSLVIPFAASFIPKYQISIFVIFFAYLYFSLITTKMALKSTKNEELTKKDITDISGGQQFILFSLWRMLYVFICFIPALFASVFFIAPVSIFGWIVTMVAFIAALLLGGFLAGSIAPSPFLAIEKKDTKARDIIYTSRIYMKGKKKEYFVLMMSMLPLVILSVITLGIAGFYTVPRIVLVRAEYYRSIGRSDVMKQERKPGLFDTLKQKRENNARFGKKEGNNAEE